MSNDDDDDNDAGDLTDFAWLDDSLETITVAVDRIAITLTIDEFFQLRKDIDTVVNALETSKEFKLCSYDDGQRMTRYLLMRRTGTEENN
jgi:hypothetical protein